MSFPLRFRGHVRSGDPQVVSAGPAAFLINDSGGLLWQPAGGVYLSVQSLTLGPTNFQSCFRLGETSGSNRFLVTSRLFYARLRFDPPGEDGGEVHQLWLAPLQAGSGSTWRLWLKSSSAGSFFFLRRALICLAKVCFLPRLQINFPESAVPSNLIDPI